MLICCFISKCLSTELCFLDHKQCKSPREKLTCMLNAIKIITSKVVAKVKACLLCDGGVAVDLLRHYGDEESTGRLCIITILLIMSFHDGRS